MAGAAESGAGIVVERFGEHVVQLRLDRQERLNALDTHMGRRLLAEIEAAAAGGARVLMVRGSGRAFSAGADLKARRAMTPDERLEHNFTINHAFNALAGLSIPTIAVLNGLALGGGCELALCCDMRVAAAGIQIGLTEVRVGTMPGAGGTQRLPRLIGTALSLELMLTGEPILAERAAAIGLVNQVFPADQLDARAQAMAMLIASRSPTGVREIKKSVIDGVGLPMAEALMVERASIRTVLASADYIEGLAAFEAKRPPVFGKDGG